jgi:translation initiation factor IF-2
VSQFSYEVASDVFRAYPGYRLGVAVFDNLDNTGSALELVEMLREAERQVRDRIVGNVAEHRIARSARSRQSTGARSSLCCVAS